MLHSILMFLCGNNHLIDRACLWAFVSSLTTIGVLVVAWVQLNNINNTAKGDFIHRFTDNFFNPKCQALIMLFDYKLLKLKVYKRDDGEDIHYFELDKEMLNKRSTVMDSKFKDNLKQIYSSYDIDDDLLGHFEDMGIYEKKGLLDAQMIDQVFGGYINFIWEDEQIKEYIRKERAVYKDESIYSEFKYIYDKINKHLTRQ